MVSLASVHIYSDPWPLKKKKKNWKGLFLYYAFLYVIAVYKMTSLLISFF